MMDQKPDQQSQDNQDKAGRTLIKAFMFAGGILAVGLYGLLRTMILFGQELGWLVSSPRVGGFHWWLLGGVVAGGMFAAGLVRWRRK